MTDVPFGDTPLFDTGQANLLLPGLTATLLHLRIEHGSEAPSERRRLMCYYLTDLVHNWPAIVAGSNRAHTVDMIAEQIGRFLATDFGPAAPHDARLRDALGALRHELHTFRKRLNSEPPAR